MYVFYIKISVYFNIKNVCSKVTGYGTNIQKLTSGTRIKMLDWISASTSPPTQSPMKSQKYFEKVDL